MKDEAHITFKLPACAQQFIQNEAAARGLSVGRYVRLLLASAIERQPAEETALMTALSAFANDLALRLPR